MTSEAYIVVVRVAPSGGRHATRHQLRIPLKLALGDWTRLSDLQLRDCLRDLQAELKHRAGHPEFDPQPTGLLPGRRPGGSYA